jgi:hypothetical protein
MKSASHAAHRAITVEIGIVTGVLGYFGRL